MNVLFQHRIYRNDLVNNRTLLYVFGDNDLRIGYGGQAREMRGEPNAFGIRTKLLPSNVPMAFMNDDDFKQNFDRISLDLASMEHIYNRHGYRRIVIPSDGLGTGLSEMPERCPKLYAALNERLAQTLRINPKDLPWMKA